jgi:serine/threonine-protein kinase RsbW
VTTTLRVQVSDLDEGITRLLDQLRAFAGGHGVPLSVQRELHLALDEIVTNIIRHGYGGGADAKVDVRMRVENGAVEVEVLDQARPFNPLEVPDPDTTLPPDMREIGGLGLYFVRQLMDSVEYTRTGEGNRVVLRRRFEAR